MDDRTPPADDAVPPQADAHADDVPPAAPDDADAPADATAPADADDEASMSAYLPIGIVFLSVALVFFMNESMRAMSWAFFPLGITFLVIGLRSRGADAAEGAGPETGAPDPDVTPR